MILRLALPPYDAVCTWPSEGAARRIQASGSDPLLALDTAPCTLPKLGLRARFADRFGCDGPLIRLMSVGRRSIP